MDLWPIEGGYFRQLEVEVDPRLELHSVALRVAGEVARINEVDGAFLRGSALMPARPEHVWDLDLVVTTATRMGRTRRQDLLRRAQEVAGGNELEVGLDILIIPSTAARSALDTELGLALAFRSARLHGARLWPRLPRVRADRALARRLAVRSINWVDEWLGRHASRAEEDVRGGLVSVFQKRTLRLAKYYSLPKGLYSRDPIDCAILLGRLGPSALSEAVASVRLDFERQVGGASALERCGALYGALHQSIRSETGAL